MSRNPGLRKRRRVTAYQRWFLNPQMRPLVWLGLVPGHVIVETIGRRTGKTRRTVVGAQRDDDGLWIVAEQGRHAGWVCNLADHPELRVRHRARWHDARALILDDDDADARLTSWGRPAHAGLVRRLGTDLTTVRVDVDFGSAAA